MKHFLFDLDETLVYHRNSNNYNEIKEDKQLTYLLQRVKHPKYIYTNAIYDHANIIVNKLKINYLFTKIYSRDTIPSMKPDINSAISLEKDIEKKHKRNTYYFFDDLVENLKTAKERKWITIWISPNFQDKYRYPFIDYSYPSIKIALIHVDKTLNLI